jgi:ferric-dicitrate binding protein FerR (iron transport regulator)
LKCAAVEPRAAEPSNPGGADLRGIDAWRTRRLKFSDTPLAWAVDVHVTGAFRIGDSEGFNFSLHEVPRVETRHSVGEALLVRVAD